MKNRKGLNITVLGDKTIAQLYNTIIFQASNNIVTLNSGGFKTNHTKNCINDLLPDGFKVFQKDYVWYIETPSNTVEFEDNIHIAV